MSEPGLLNPIPPCPPRASKRQNRGDPDLTGGVSPQDVVGWGNDKGKDEVEKVKWPKWGERILAGRRDPGSEFKTIHAITSGLFLFFFVVVVVALFGLAILKPKFIKPKTYNSSKKKKKQNEHPEKILSAIYQPTKIEKKIDTWMFFHMNILG